MSRFVQYLLTRNLHGKELTDEKIRDFKRIVFAQCSIITSILLLAVFERIGFQYYVEIAELIFFACLGVYIFLLWDTLRNYTTSRRIILANFILIIGVYVVSAIGTNPFIPMAPTFGYRMFLMTVLTILLTVETFVIYFTTLEFFKKELSLTIKLWGAAALYLMIGLAFGCVYEVSCIADLDCMPGLDVPLRTVALMKRIQLSLMVLGGMDVPFEPSGVIYALGMIEALWGQIFIVLIVGRLLVK